MYNKRLQLMQCLIHLRHNSNVSSRCGYIGKKNMFSLRDKTITLTAQFFFVMPLIELIDKHHLLLQVQSQEPFTRV